MNEHTTFDTPSPVTLVLELPSGDVTVEARDTATTVVDLEPRGSGRTLDDARELIDSARVEQRRDEVLVLLPRRKRIGREPEVRARVRLPSGSSVRVQTASADVEVDGRLASADITTASGEVQVDDVAGAAKVRSASGDVDLQRVGGQCTVKAASGDVSVREVGGELRIDTASGDLEVGSVAGAAALTTASGDVHAGRVGDVHCRTASGEVVLDEVAAGKVTVGTASGDVSVGIRDGSAAWLDVSSLSGRVASGLDVADSPQDGQPVVELRVRTMSGDVSVRRA